MGWIFLEIGLALAIALGIVWWTMPRKSRPKEKDSAGRPPEDDAPPGGRG